MSASNTGTEATSNASNTGATLIASDIASADFKPARPLASGSGDIIFASANKGTVYLKRNKEILAELGRGDVIAVGLFEGISKNEMTKKNDYRIRSSNGDLIIVNGGGNLGYQMEPVSVGQLVKITYKGAEAMSKGPYKGKLANNYSVEVA